MKKNNKGFSLVELIIVIAIMAVLIGLLAPQYLRFVKKSKVSADVSNAQALATAFNVAFADGISLGTSYVSGTNDIPDEVNADWPETKLEKDGVWTVSLDEDGVSSITITYTGKSAVTVWPTADGYGAEAGED